MRGKKTETEGGLSRALNPSYSQTESPVGRQRFSDLSIAVEKKKVPVDREGYEHGPGVKKKKKKKTEPCIFLKNPWVKKKKINLDILMVPVRLEEGLRTSPKT